MGNIIQNTITGIKQLKNADINTTGIALDALTSLPSLSSEVLNYFAPDNYEVYDCIIQIVRPVHVEGTPELIAQFDFTIMPESLEVPHKYRTQVVPTIYNNFILDSIYEAPAQFTLTGNFGVNHKLLFNVKAERQDELSGEIHESEDKAAAATEKAGKSLAESYVSKFVTGYGLCKRLEKLVKLTHQADENTGLPYKTYLISRAFNFSMRVEILSASFKQSISKNRVWQYDLTLNKVADEKSPWKTETSLWDVLYKKVERSVLSYTFNGVGNQVFGLLNKYV